jgi:ABC-type transport system substrate-binding protein
MTSETFDPLANIDGVDKNAMHQIFDTLLRLDDQGQVIPCLADSWTESEDGKSVTFKLHQGVSFTDGTPFNADAVVFSFQTVMAGPLASNYTSYFGTVSKVDDYTVTIDKGSAYSAFYNALAEGPYIVSPTAYQADPAAFAKNPVGTGAYKFASQGSDGYVHLTANTGYFMGAPYFENLIIRTPLDASTAVVALQNKEVDIAINLTPNQLPVVEQDPSLKAEISPGWSVKMMSMEGAPFTDNEKLRQAITYAINPDNARVYNNEPDAPLATDLFASKVMGDYAGLVPIHGYDADKAKQLLADSGYDTTQPIPIVIGPDGVAIAQSMQADLAAIGLTANIQQLDQNAYYSAMDDGTTGLSVTDFGTDQSSCEDLLSFYTSTGYYGKFSESSDEFDNIMEQLKSLYNEADRKPLVKQALTLEQNFANFYPLYESTFNFVHQADLTGFNPMSGPTYVYYLGDVKPVNE